MLFSAYEKMLINIFSYAEKCIFLDYVDTV